MIIVMSSLSKSSVKKKMSAVLLAASPNFSSLKNVFDSGPNRRNKADFSNFSDAVRTGPCRRKTSPVATEIV